MDIRVKTFVAEACHRIGAALEPLGFIGPEVTEGDTYPFVMSVRYHRSDVSAETQLVLAYAGEEYVHTFLAWRAEDSSGGRRVDVGVDTARTGYQMRRALDRHAQAIPDLFRQVDGNS